MYLPSGHLARLCQIQPRNFPRGFAWTVGVDVRALSSGALNDPLRILLSHYFLERAIVFSPSSPEINTVFTGLSSKETPTWAAGVLFCCFLNCIFDLLVILIFEGVAGGDLFLDYLCLGKTAQLSIPVIWKGVRHIFSFNFKPEDSADGEVPGRWEI